ncbi:MAG: zinc-binding alcohol dehydrogenase [Chthonomonadales bacterium]|nr:zinc-binding alcohol dehydrogenase [Chthonomonadales bacterium]
MKARAIVFRGPGVVGLDDFDVREPGPGEVLVRAHHTCISPGTELRCLAGKQPNPAPWPFIPGYAMAGEVIEAGPGARFEPGAMVYLNGTADAGRLARMWGGHASHAIAPDDSCIDIPRGVSTLEASFAHLAGIAYHGSIVSGAAPGDTVAVIGLGVLGQMCARMYALLGCRAVACDVNADRVQTARRLGTKAELVSGDLAAALGPHIPEGPDVIADVTGNARVMNDAIRIARDVPWEDAPIEPTTYVVQGSYPDVLPVPYQDAFLKQLVLKFPRDCTRGDRARVMELMAQGGFDARSWISSEESPENAEEIYRELSKPDSKQLTVVFRWT